MKFGWVNDYLFRCPKCYGVLSATVGQVKPSTNFFDVAIKSSGKHEGFVIEGLGSSGSKLEVGEIQRCKAPRSDPCFRSTTDRADNLCPASDGREEVIIDCSPSAPRCRRVDSRRGTPAPASANSTRRERALAGSCRAPARANSSSRSPCPYPCPRS